MGQKLPLGISCKKSRFYAKKIIFFPILGGGGRESIVHFLMFCHTPDTNVSGV
jgi:hypothetical protein